MSSVSSKQISDQPAKPTNSWKVTDGLSAISLIIILPILLGIAVFSIAQVLHLPSQVGKILLDETPTAVLAQYLIGLVIESVVVIWFMRLRHITPAMIGWIRPRWRWFGVALSLYGAQLILAIVAITVVKALWPSLNLEEVQDIKPFGQANWAIVASFIASVMIAPVIEELLFRGLLFGSLRTKLPVWLAAVIAAAVFGLLHAQASVMIYTFMFGLLLAWLYHRSRSLWPGILLHLLNNGVAFWVLLHS